MVAVKTYSDQGKTMLMSFHHVIEGQAKNTNQPPPTPSHYLLHNELLYYPHLTETQLTFVL